MKKYYCTEHSFDRSHPISSDLKVKCQAKGFCGCDNTATFEVEEGKMREKK